MVVDMEVWSVTPAMAIYGVFGFVAICGRLNATGVVLVTFKN